MVLEPPARRPYRIPRHAPVDDFPPVERAMLYPDGLLAVGGDLRPERILSAYQKGIFPWYNEGQPILWWSPDPRMVLFPEHLKVSRSLRKNIRNNGFSITLNHSFAEVISLCAAMPRNGQKGTWITRDMQRAYLELHELGAAHSVECFHQDKLVGGLYGIGIGRVFFGESMFSRMSNASKSAFAVFTQHLRTLGYELIDCQVYTPHLESLGAVMIPRREFARLLRALCPAQPAGKLEGKELHPAGFSSA